ncbi:muskelin [Nasonia vitripennis]|uniref:Muskelin N-terminal domain-containing protein n=1 Tax=Nasonia vitripennis TaxID=7425 RepID=A0A7M7G9B8_NASVI|nr:muskelin [Nasonia vitripennis]
MSFNMDDNMASSEGTDFEKTLEYRIYKCSSYSSQFVPENILIDKPSDQTSRWSTDNDNHPQNIILKLQQPSIVKTITFGKFEKAHVCNIRKFKVYGGLEPENMMELVESGLKNDSTPETFELRCSIGGKDNYFPIKYIKILLLQSWGPNMNCSVWHIRLTGTNDIKLVKPSMDWINVYRQKEVVRLCMKHFRKYQQQDVVEILEKVTGVSLEDSQLSALYDLLVVKGDHAQAERFISNAVNMGLLDEYINSQSYQVLWKKISTPDPKPGMRGGHQMVLDSQSEVLYLFGGWNGNQDLADLWLYDINTSKWSLICQDTAAVGGPSARSCHKMCLDPGRRQLFTLGRYLDTQYRTPENLKSDFYVYNIESNKWTLISEDTAAVGGPELIFDHQMLMDIEKRTIYVFGGRILVPTASPEENTTNSNESLFSGLYSYHVPTGTWQKLACDISRPSIQNVPSIRSRVGHSMLFHPGSRKLYMFAGQRGKEYLNDFFTYEVDTNKVEHISLSELGNKDSNHIPAAGFTQRATIDPELGEIYVLSGLSKDKDKRDENVQNSFWVYNIKNNRWSCIYRNENMGEKYWSKMQNFEPCPRFAHQLVYDHVKKVHYLFGGNPGRACLPKLRLDDFWQLQLCRPSHEKILTKCKLIIRKHKFEELSMHNSIEALQYLQTEISEIIDHNDLEQTKEFQLLASILFRDQNTSMSEPTQEDDDISDILGLPSTDFGEQSLHTRRTELYDKLSEFFPESLTQPRANLMDLLPL